MGNLPVSIEKQADIDCKADNATRTTYLSQQHWRQSHASQGVHELGITGVKLS